MIGRDTPRPSPLFSGHPAVSADGRLVVFTSGATKVVAGTDANGTSEDVYAFDTATRVIRRVSVDGNGVQRASGASFAPSVSGDGRFVAFTSTADLDGVAAGAPGYARRVPSRPLAQVYVRDLVLGVTTRVSVSRDGWPLDGASYDAAISRDGGAVAFVSAAANLLPGDRNRSPDVFMREMEQRSTALISRTPNGATANGPSGNPAISADGRFVAFQSEASDLVCVRACSAALEDVNLLPDVFLFDRATPRMTRISAGAAGWAEESGAAHLNATGEIVTFTSRHPIDEQDVRNDFDLFLRVSASAAVRTRNGRP